MVRNAPAGDDIVTVHSRHIVRAGCVAVPVCRKSLSCGSPETKSTYTVREGPFCGPRQQRLGAAVPSRKCQAFPEFVPLSGGVPFARCKWF